jgi:hypothetical protein
METDEEPRDAAPARANINSNSNAVGTLLVSVGPPFDFRQTIKRYPQFSEKIFSWTRFPCSLHFADAAPSNQAVQALEQLSELLGPLGKYEGSYGAGGGPIHILYLGATPSYNEGNIAEMASLPTMLEMLRLAPHFRPPATQWMTTLDPLHQTLFPKTMADTIEFCMISCYTEEDHRNGVADDRYERRCRETPQLFERFYRLVSSQENAFPATRIYLHAVINDRISKEFAFVKEARIVFVQPRFDHIHDGDCRAVNCPLDDALVIAESTEGVAHASGDIYQSPVYAMIQLQETGELMVLAQWDYRG